MPLVISFDSLQTNWAKSPIFFCLNGEKDLEAWLEKVQKIAEEVAQREGCELYDFEVVGSGKGRVLRVYIDKENGIDIEDCSNVSKGLNLLLDVEDIVPGGMYNLEVSSPGLDRHLKTIKHFSKAIGKKVFVQLSQNLGSLGAQDKGLLSMKKFENEVKSVDGDNIVFEIKNEEIKVPIHVVDKAKLVFEMKVNKPPGHKNGGNKKR